MDKAIIGCRVAEMSLAKQGLFRQGISGCTADSKINCTTGLNHNYLVIGLLNKAHSLRSWMSIIHMSTFFDL